MRDAGTGAAPERSPNGPLTPLPVTIVVVTRNRAGSLLATLPHLGAVRGEPSPGAVRVIVVDNGSTDGTPAAVAEAFPAVEVVPLRSNHGSAARNVGVALASTPFVAFSDDDSWWAPRALGRAVALLDRHPEVAVVAARVLVGPEGRLDPVCDAMRTSPLGAEGLPGPRVRGFVACGAVVRRDAFLSVGGFHPRMGIGGEEELLAADVAAGGWELVYADDVVAHHHPSPVRDPASRRRTVVRNRLWSLWLRRPLASCVRETARLAAGGWRDPGFWRGAGAALAGSLWVLRERRPVPRDVDRELSRVESAWRAA